MIRLGRYGKKRMVGQVTSRLFRNGRAFSTSQRLQGYDADYAMVETRISSAVSNVTKSNGDRVKYRALLSDVYGSSPEGAIF